MDFLSDFLTSSFALPVLFVGIFLLPLLIHFRNWAKRNALLHTYFNGTHSFLRWDLLVNYEGHQFHFSEAGTGQMTSHPLGIIPTLWMAVEAPATFLCTSTQATRNSFHWKLGTYAYRKDVIIGEKSLFIGADSEIFQEKVETVFKSGDVAALRIATRLLNDAESFQVKESFCFGGKHLFGKKCIFRYTGFPVTVYKNPDQLEAQLKDIVALLRQLGIRPASTHPQI